MADNNLFKERAQILEQIKRIQAEQGKEAAKLDDAYIKLKGRLSEIVKVLETTVKKQRESVQGIVDVNNEAQSLSAVYKNIQKETITQRDLQLSVADSIATQLDRVGQISEKNTNQANIVNDILAGYQDQASLATKLAQLSEEDAVERANIVGEMAVLQEIIQEQVNSLDKRTAIAKDFMSVQGEIESSIEAQTTEAKRLSSLTSEQKQILEEQAAVFKKIQDKVDALGSTLTTFLRRPQAIIGGLVVGAGVLVDKFADVNRQLGNGFDILNSTTASAGVLGFVFEDTAGTVKALASEFGGTEAATFQTQANIGLMATNMGISNTEAVSLSGSFARLNGNSTDIAADMVKTTQEFAKQNGIVPSALMADLAASTEEFALFGDEGGENILRAAGFASKLGTNMKTLSGIAEGLLDFESSITKELELGAMLGKNINLDRARQLALEGDIEGATNATLDALGGIEAFNEMDYFQKKATADLLGVSVGELQKMAQNQENANSLGAVMNERFSVVGETINAGLNKYLGTGLKGLGGMITMSGELGRGFKSLGIDMGGIAKKTGSALKNLLMWPVKKIGGMFGGVGEKATESVTSKAKDSITEKITGGTDGGDLGKKGGMMDSMSKINMNAVLKGAAALVIVAGAVFVFGKAVQEFMKVSWEAVGMAVVSMLALVGAVALLGAIMTSGVGAVAILAGAAAMLVIAASVLVLGHALQAIGTGFEMMSTGIQSLMPQLMAVATTIGGLVTLIPSIALLAYSIMGLSGSLVALGVAGIVAAPGLMALSAVGAISTGLNSLLGGDDTAEGGEGGDSALLEEIRGLRADLNDGKVGVYMDGTKVTAAISTVVNKVGSNSYAIT